MIGTTARSVLVVVDDQRPVGAALVVEALSKAARDSGCAVTVARPGDGGARGASLVLLVGEPGDVQRYAPTPTRTLTVEAVLADPVAALAPIMAAPAAGAVDATPRRRLVAVTSCPTGIAHTFMAAEALKRAAAALGHEIRVETQGSVGSGDTLTAAEIAAADAVIIAADRQVDPSRFAGKPISTGGTKPAIRDGKAVITRALADADAAPRHAAGAAASLSAPPPPRARAPGPYRHLMTGVSFMLPFVVAGGLLIALAFAIGGIHAADPAQAGTLAGQLFTIGSKGAFALIVPALAGYIAFSIADRPGIAPGMVGGMMANQLGAGFLGGIVAGFVAGYAVSFLTRSIRLPRTLEGLKPVLILPLLGTLVTGLLMVAVLASPVAGLLALLTQALRHMQGSSAVALGLLLGGMMAVDMGGPVNKAAYAFSVGLLASNVDGPMAAVMVAGMTPPLALALSTRLFPARFTADERESAGAAAVLGLAFVTEGAIPFAASDPLRVLPSLIAGSAVAGAISMVGHVELRVPHGGVFVLPIPNAVTHLGLYVVALAAGTLVSTAALGLLKRHDRVPPTSLLT